MITAPIQTQGTQRGTNTVVNTISSTNTNTNNNSATTTTASSNSPAITIIAKPSENSQSQGFQLTTTGPDITQILAGIQSAIQTLTNDVKELKADKQQQQLQQQQQQQQQWAPQVYYSQ